jgi:hypothetical protein
MQVFASFAMVQHSAISPNEAHVTKLALPRILEFAVFGPSVSVAVLMTALTAKKHDE